MALDKVSFFINGKRQDVASPPPDLTLVEYLRNTLHLTGTKVACGVGGCGSCTVTLAEKGQKGQWTHRAINSCLAKVWTLHGLSITTIEGLGSPGDHLHPLQKRIHQSHGVQCGFCTPGMVMSMSSKLRDSNSDPHALIDIEDVEKCLQGNLCRCTGYANIVEGFKGLSKEDCSQFDPVDPPQEVVANLQFGSSNCFAPVDVKGLKSLIDTLDEYEFILGGTGTYQVQGNDLPTRNKVYLGHIPELKLIEVDEGKSLTFGSANRLADASKVFQDFDCFQPFCQALDALASPQVRNMASIGGSIFWSHPSSDLWPLYLVFGCRVKFDPLDGSDPVELAIEDVGSRKGLVLQLIVPWPDSKLRGVFKKMARRKEFDLSILNMGGLISTSANGVIEEVKLAFGGSDEILTLSKNMNKAKLASSCMAYLKGRSIDDITEEALKEAIATDLLPNNKSLYRIHLAAHFVSQLLAKQSSSCDLSKERLVIKSDFGTNHGNDKCSSDLVHKLVPHLWGEELACGTGVFVDDMESFRDGLEVVLIRSSRAHAKITKLDFSTALQCEGVVGTISASDISRDQNMWGLVIPDEEIFASGKVEYHGQIIAGLVCTKRELGIIASTKVNIEYEDLPFVLNLNHARNYLNMDLDDLAFFSLSGEGESVVTRRQTSDDPTNGDGLKISGSLRVGSAEHFYMEPHSVLAVPIKEKDEMVVYQSTQEVGKVQPKLSKALDVPMHKIIVKNKRCGGGFGGKERTHTSLIAALAAKKFKRPVKLILSRCEDMSTTGSRHESVVDYEVLVDKKTGKVLDADFKAYANAGSSSDLSPIWAQILLLRMGGGYTFSNFHGRARAVKTNSPSNTAFRGFGGPEAAVFIETIMDRIGHELQMSQLQVRLANLTKEDDLLHHSESRIKGCTLRQCWDECLARSNFAAKEAAIEEFNRAHHGIKRGIAVVPIKFEPCLGDKTAMLGHALIRVYEDGSVLLTHGGIEMGQGIHTKMIQIATRALGIPADLIHINEVSSETLANTMPTGGSSGTDLNGPAVLDACQKLMARLEPYKSGSSWQSWVAAALADRVNLNVEGFHRSDYNYNFAQQSGDYFAYLTYGVGAVQVQVDCKTGQVEVLSADLVMDLGKSLNPAIDVGQVHGAFVQGMGTVLTEQLVRDVRTGKLLTDGPSHYKIPTVADIPRELNVTLVQGKETTGPTSPIYSSKGVGEPPINFSAGIVLAAKHAIAHYRRQNGNDDWFCLEPPCTPEKVWKSAHPHVKDTLFQASFVEM